MRKITTLVLNDEEETTYRTLDAENKSEGISVKDIYYVYHELNVDLLTLIVEFDDERDDIEVPYHSVLLIRREK